MRALVLRRGGGLLVGFGEGAAEDARADEDDLGYDAVGLGGKRLVKMFAGGGGAVFRKGGKAGRNVPLSRLCSGGRLGDGRGRLVGWGVGELSREERAGWFKVVAAGVVGAWIRNLYVPLMDARKNEPTMEMPPAAENRIYFGPVGHTPVALAFVPLQAPVRRLAASGTHCVSSCELLAELVAGA